MNKPVLIVGIVLIALAALFAIGIGAGVRGDQGSAKDERNSGLLDKLGGLAGQAADADVATIKASCPGLPGSPSKPPKPAVLTFTGACAVAVTKADARIRLVRLQSEQALSIDAPAPEGDLDDIEADVKPREVAKIAVGKNGAGDDSADDARGPIVIHCPGLGQSCQVTLLNGT